MKYLIGLFVILMSGCAQLAPLPPVDAAPVISQGGSQVTTAMGARVTGRDWNNPPFTPSESGESGEAAK